MSTEEFDDGEQDATRGLQIAPSPYDDATQGRKIGSDPSDDATRARRHL